MCTRYEVHQKDPLRCYNTHIAHSAYKCIGDVTAISPALVGVEPGCTSAYLSLGCCWFTRVVSTVKHVWTLFFFISDDCENPQSYDLSVHYNLPYLPRQLSQRGMDQSIAFRSFLGCCDWDGAVNKGCKWMWRVLSNNGRFSANFGTTPRMSPRLYTR